MYLDWPQLAEDVADALVAADIAQPNATTSGAVGGLEFVASTRTIERVSGSFVSDGWEAQMVADVSGSTSNDGTVRVKAVSALVLTLQDGTVLVDEGPVGGVTLDNRKPRDDTRDTWLVIAEQFSLHHEDTAWQEPVISLGDTTPPIGPSPGDRYILGAVPTGDWVGQAYDVAERNPDDDGWYFFDPQEGWTAWVSDEDKHYVFDGSIWQTHPGLHSGDYWVKPGLAGGQVNYGGLNTGDGATIRGTAHGDNNGDINLNDQGGDVHVGGGLLTVSDSALSQLQLRVGSSPKAAFQWTVSGDYAAVYSTTDLQLSADDGGIRLKAPSATDIDLQFWELSTQHASIKYDVITPELLIATLESSSDIRLTPVDYCFVDGFLGVGVGTEIPFSIIEGRGTDTDDLRGMTFTNDSTVASTPGIQTTFRLAQAGGDLKTAGEFIVDKDATWGSNASTSARMSFGVVEANVMQSDLLVIDGTGPYTQVEQEFRVRSAAGNPEFTFWQDATERAEVYYGIGDNALTLRNKESGIIRIQSLATVDPDVQWWESTNYMAHVGFDYSAGSFLIETFTTGAPLVIKSGDGVINLVGPSATDVALDFYETTTKRASIYLDDSDDQLVIHASAANHFVRILGEDATVFGGGTPTRLSGSGDIYVTGEAEINDHLWADNGLTGTVTDAVTDAVSTVATLTHLSSGTAASGFGTRLLYQAEGVSEAAIDAAAIDAVLPYITQASDDGQLDFLLWDDGASALTKRASLAYAAEATWDLFSDTDEDAGFRLHENAVEKASIYWDASGGVLVFDTSEAGSDIEIVPNDDLHLLPTHVLNFGESGDGIAVNHWIYDEKHRFHSSDLAHGMTTDTATTVGLELRLADADYGCGWIQGFGAANANDGRALILAGKSSRSALDNDNAAVAIYGQKIDGTTTQKCDDSDLAVSMGPWGGWNTVRLFGGYNGLFNFSRFRWWHCQNRWNSTTPDVDGCGTYSFAADTGYTVTASTASIHGAWIRTQTDNTTYDSCLHSSGERITQPDWDPVVYEARMQFEGTNTWMLLWFGLFNTQSRTTTYLGNSDPSADFIGFRYSASTTGNANWFACSKDNSASIEATDTGITGTASGMFHLRIILFHAQGKCEFWINDQHVATNDTSLPRDVADIGGVTAGLYPVAFIATQTGAVRGFYYGLQRVESK